MNPKFLLSCILLTSMLVGCNLTSSTMVPTTISTTAPTLEFVDSTPFQPISPTQSIILIPALPASIQQAVLDRASEVIALIKAKDLITLSNYVHPMDGLRFSPYAFVNATDQVFPADEVASLLADSTVYSWGTFSGSGAPIDITFTDYYSKFIYDVDFANAPQLALNHRLGMSTSLDNSHEFYPGAMIVEYYFPGFDPQFEGLDWRSLRLVFLEENNTWYLVCLIHDQWTT